VRVRMCQIYSSPAIYAAFAVTVGRGWVLFEFGVRRADALSSGVWILKSTCHDQGYEYIIQRIFDE
jgi:hypothetical protein